MLHFRSLYISLGSIVLIFLSTSHVFAVVYSASVNRVELTQGLNVNGEEFNNFPDPESWQVQEGTVSVLDGYLHLTNPSRGNYFEQDGVFISHERSAFKTEIGPEALNTAEGAGDFSIDSQWTPVFPDTGRGYGMTFHYPPTEFNQVRVGIDNLDATMLSLMGAPEETLPGTYIGFTQVSPGPGTGLYSLNMVSQSFPVTPEMITGEIVFRLLYDDATNSFNAAVSLDGGTTFIEPFVPFPITTMDGPERPLFELEAGYFKVGDTGPAESPWPMHRQNSKNTGQSSMEGPWNVGLKWRYPLPASVIEEHPVIGPDGTIYICNRNVTFAFNSDGTLKWSFTLPAGSNRGTPSVSSEGTIYVPCDYSLYALDPDGSLKWEYSVSSVTFANSVTIGKNMILIGAGVDLLALNLDGTLNWSHRVGEEINLPPAIADDGSIYVRGRYEFLVKLDSNGSELWTLDLDTTASCSRLAPTLGSDGTVYTWGNIPYPGGGQVAGLYAINPDSTLKWVYPDIMIPDSGIYTAITVAEDGTVYFSGKTLGVWNDLVFVALKPEVPEPPEEQLKWVFRLDEAEYNTTSAPAIDSDGTIYFGTSENHLYALNPNGTLKWRFESVNSIGSSPAIGADNTIYFGAEDGYFYAVGEKEVGLGNVIMVLQLLAGMDTSSYEFEADVNMDGQIGLAEAVQMIKLISLE